MSYPTNPAVVVLQAIFKLISDYIALKPKGKTQSYSTRLNLNTESTQLFFKAQYDDVNTSSSSSFHPRTPVSYIRVRNIGPNNLYMGLNGDPGDAQVSTPIFAGTEWVIQLDKNTIWSLAMKAELKTGVVETYTDVVVDFMY